MTDSCVIEQHVFQLPTFHSLLTYHAHSASVTAISISPFPPPLPTPSKPETSSWLLGTGTSTPLKSPTFSEMPSAAAAARRVTSQQLHSSPLRHATGKPSQPHVPNVPSNQIYIATASLDGHVCVQSLVDLRDVSLRNFARPVKAVALSPEFRSDRTYLSGGLAGQLVLTVGAGHGLTTSSTTGGVAAVAQAASGWLGAVGLGSSGSGKDTVLHQGEGTISCIRWSGSGRFVAWLNETGIKIMRTNLKLDSASAESQDDAWKRIGHIDRPQTQEWDEMAGLWQGRAEWIDESALDVDEADAKDGAAKPADTTPSPAKEMLKEQVAKDKKRMERLLVGWGGMIWIIHVHAGSIGTGKNVGEKTAGRAEIVKM